MKSNRQIHLTILATLMFMCITAAAQAVVTPQTMSYNGLPDTHFDTVYNGYGGTSETLGDALSNLSTPITRPTSQGGGTLNVGNINAGETPALSDQTQIQRYLVTDEDADIKLTYLGLGKATYKSYFGIYTYPINNPAAALNPTKTQLFTQNVDTPGGEIVFTVPEDHYFGFYIDADAYRSSQGVYYSENIRNSDNDEPNGLITDHFLIFNSNVGHVLAIEDLAYNSGTGKLGDQDYEDMIVGFITMADGTPFGQTDVPEPAALMMILLLTVALATRRPARGKTR